VNATGGQFSYLGACTGTTTSTCLGTRVNVSVTGLTTAASGVSAAMTVTDTSIVASSQVICSSNAYAGTTGDPIITNIVPGAGQFTFTVRNVATSGALNGTVTAACLVLN
jgi:hypothetical protein